MKYDILFEGWMQQPEKMKRQFTVRCQTECELLTIGVKDIERMNCEFHDAYEALFKNQIVRLSNILKIKLRAIKQCCSHVSKSFNLIGDGQETFQAITIKEIDEKSDFYSSDDNECNSSDSSTPVTIRSAENEFEVEKPFESTVVQQSYSQDDQNQ